MQAGFIKLRQFASVKVRFRPSTIHCQAIDKYQESYVRYFAIPVELLSIFLFLEAVLSHPSITEMSCKEKKIIKKKHTHIKTLQYCSSFDWYERPVLSAWQRS
jgi:hypothetical protein